MNACLDRISELIAASTADLATQDDLATLQHLQEEFATELASLRGRVDGLESRVAELEENQFSTTTRLRGTAIFAVADVFGDSGDENQTVGQYRANLNFLTSFTGRDLLVTSVWAGNVPTLGVGFDLPGTRAGGIEIPSAEGTLSISDPRDGRGLFKGGCSAIGQITWTTVQEFSIAATYINAYFPGGRYGFNYNSLAVTGTAVANTLAGQTRLSAQRLFNVDPVITNSYGVQAAFQPSPRFAISGWFGATYARLIEQGDGRILNYALTFAFPDLGQKGNLLGLVFGAEPYLT